MTAQNHNTLDDGSGNPVKGPAIIDGYFVRSDLECVDNDKELMERLNERIIFHGENPDDFGFICTRFDGYTTNEHGESVGTCGTEIRAVRKGNKFTISL